MNEIIDHYYFLIKNFLYQLKKKNQMFLTIYRDTGIYIEIKSRFLQQNFS